MKKGQILEGNVLRTDFPGKGIVETDEGRVICANALEGQRVRVRVLKVRKGTAQGQVLEVMERAGTECGVTCAHFGACGGCIYLSMTYPEQTALKERQMKRLLGDRMLQSRELFGQEAVWDGILESPKPLEYRNKMEFSFGDEYKGGPLALGMHRRGSFYDLVTVTDCRIVDSDYRFILKTVRDFFAEKEIPYFHKGSHEGYLRHLLIRKAARTGEILLGLVTSSQAPANEEALLRELQAALLESPEAKNALTGEITGFLHIVNDSVADVIRADEARILYGRDHFFEELLGLRFRISVFSFFQTNTLGAEVLYGRIREYVKACDDGHFGTVYDLYCGTGTITQLLSRVCDRCVGVELVEEAVLAAQENARENGISNCAFIAGDVLKVLDDLTEPPQLIVLDPPRDGIHPKALPKILSYGAKHLLYVACKPTSLERDLGPIFEAGYRIRRISCVDQFPWTGGVEVICLLDRV
ncbi:MAG: 23S rRNA (uracil(1939)-C(5))-methyltransferase RlmD [Lachnospiraceae bacterium]|nr:23S rRNA (uracil(1939)-C(5))-methyltransferase RlmD [Lachnospiraceae bacterium]